MKNNLTPHISMAEATKSNTATRQGIDNEPDAEQLENMKTVALNCFEPLRNHFGVPIGVSSFFRSEELNEALGGSDTSDHCKGKAIDIDADIYNKPGVTNAAIFHWLRENVEFDQLIWEYNQKDAKGREMPDDCCWVHVSFRPGANRGQVLRAVRGEGYQFYE